MTITNKMETSLLTEHLRSTPLTLLDDIINTVNEVVTRAVDAAESGLQSTNPANLGFDRRAEKEGLIPDVDVDGKIVYPEARAEVEEGLHKLETLLESNVDRNFDKFEIYVLRGVLNVPEELAPWVRLGHYAGIKLPGKNEKVSTAEEVQRLQHKLRQTRKLNAALEATVARNQLALEQIRTLVEGPSSSSMKVEQTSPGAHDSADRTGSYRFLTHGQGAKTLGIIPITERPSGQESTGPLQENTSFALSQLPALRNLLDELRPKLAELGDAQSAAKESHFGRERRNYLNTQARKTIERQGVEVDDAAADLGRRVHGDEVAALESIAEGLGAARSSDDQMEE